MSSLYAGLRKNKTTMTISSPYSSKTSPLEGRIVGYIIVFFKARRWYAEHCQWSPQQATSFSTTELDLMRTDAHTHTDTHTHRDAQTHTHTQLHASMKACMNECAYICRYLHVCTYVCLYVIMCVCMCTCMYVCMYVCMYERMYM